MSGLGHLVIAETDADQPFHLREIGGNGEPVSSTETYASRMSAENAVLFRARLFGWENPRLLTTVPAEQDERADRVAVVICDNVDAHVVIRYVDERDLAEAGFLSRRPIADRPQA